MGIRLSGLVLLATSTAATAQDTIRVQANGAPKWGANVRLVQEAAIGQLDGPPEYAFGRVFHGSIEPGGGFYLYDANDRQIRRYDRTGTFRNLVGKRGAGPGEYDYVAALATTRAGELIVHDGSTSRISYFLPDGKLLRDFPLLRGGSWATNFVIDTVGRIYLGAALPGRQRNQLLRLTPEGDIVDSTPLPVVSVPIGPGQPFYLSTSDGMRWNFVEMNLVSPYIPGGYLTARSNAYRFIVVVPGRPVLMVERRQALLRLGAEERDDWLRAAEFVGRNPRGPQQRYQIPTHKQAIRGLRSDHLGRIWVEVPVVAERRNEPATRPDGRPQLLFWKERTTYDVFSPDGDYLGRVAFPPEHILLDIRDNRLLALTKGADGEDRVIVYRLDVPGVR